jgi:hypothetical protein
MGNAMGLLSWFDQKIERRRSDRAADQLDQFVIRLKGFDDRELGLVAACVGYTCQTMLKFGINLMRPGEALLANPTLQTELSRIVLSLQRSGRAMRAPGIMVWVHTLRAEQRIELRHLAKQMWGEIERGFPHALDASWDFERLTGKCIPVLPGMIGVPIGYRRATTNP